MVKWLRTAGGAAELFGWGGLMLGDWFWFGVVSIYLGFALLALDVGFEPDFRNKWGPKLSIWGVLLVVVVAFSWVIVFVNGPLPVSAFATDGEYPAGYMISGISWKPQFTELDVDLTNPTDSAYQDLNIVLRPTSPVAAIAQVTDIADVSFEDKNSFSTHMLDLNLQTGVSKAIPLVLVATDAGYRVRCGRLPSHDDLKVVMALADMKWPTASNVPRGAPFEEQVRDMNYLFRVKFDDFSTYWLGYRDGDIYATRPRPTSTEWLKVDGDYTVGHRRRTISQKVQFGGALTIKPQAPSAAP